MVDMRCSFLVYSLVPSVGVRPLTPDGGDCQHKTARINNSFSLNVYNINTNILNKRIWGLNNTLLNFVKSNIPKR